MRIAGFRGMGLILCASLALAACGHRAYVAHCDAPRASLTSDVALVLMPYEYAGESRELSADAAKLARFTQLQMLHTGMAYDSFGVTLLLPASRSEATCDPLDVEDKLTGRKPNPAFSQIVPSTQDLLIWWGRVYEESGAIYVQNNLRLVNRQGRRFIHRKRVEGLGEFQFEGLMPARSIVFPARRLTGEDLEKLQTALARASEVRDAPDAEKSKVIGTLNTEMPVRIALSRVQDFGSPGPGWAEVQRADGTKGYIRLGDQASPGSLLMPELYFLQGLVGLLQFSRPQVSVSPKAHLSLVEHAFETFRRIETAPGTGDTRLASNLLQGFVELSYGSRYDDAATIRRAADNFAVAAKALPLNSEIRTLLALARIVSCCEARHPEQEQREIERMLISAIVADPTNQEAATNLESYYDYLVAARIEGPFDTRTVSAKQHQLRAFREAAAVNTLK